MKQTLQLKLGQQLSMTPQLQQAIRLLQLSTLDLKQEIQQKKTGNFRKFRKITENRENSGNCRNSVKNAKSGNRGWAPKRAPDPAPLGAPCYYKTVG